MLRTLLIVAVVGCLSSIATTNATAEDAAAKKLPIIVMETTKGTVVIELFEDEAPNTVANFVNLVEKKFYDGLTFHRVIDKFMAQGGCPQGTGTGGPGYNIKCECSRADARKNERGTISMAHAGPNTGGSQFFINYGHNRHLDGKHTVFGRVIKGMEAIDKLNSRGSADKMTSVTVKSKRDHKYVPTTHPGR